MKLKYILPIVTLSGGATIAMPLVSCGNTTEAGPTLNIKIDQIVDSKIYSEEMNFDKNATYNLEVEWDDIVTAGHSDETGSWGLLCGTTGGLNAINSFEESSIKAWQNEESLEVKTGTPYQTDADFVYFENDQLAGLVIGREIGFQSGDVIKFELKLKQNVDLASPSGKFVIGMF